MKILIHGINYSPENVGIAVYTSGLAEALVEAGHEVRVVAGRPYYPQWSRSDGYCPAQDRAVVNGVNIVRVPHYVPRKPSGAKRVWHHLSFALTSAAPVLRSAFFWRPDVVLAVAPSLLSAPVAALAARFSGARSWLHVQDLEVDAAFATSLLPGHGIAVKLARWFEGAILRRFGTISAISPQMCQRLLDKGIDAKRLTEFRNWADVGSIFPQHDPSAYRQEWNIDARHVALYSGSIGQKHGFELVLEAARRLEHRKDIAFVVCSEGPQVDRLRYLARESSNLSFHPLQPAGCLNALLGLASVHLLPQSAAAADLMLPSKLANMLSSGRPVVATALAGSGLFEEVDGCGICTPPGDAAAFALAIAHLVDSEEERARLGQQARLRAIERWSKDAVLRTFIDRVAGLEVKARPGIRKAPAS